MSISGENRLAYIGGSDVPTLLLGEQWGETPHTLWQRKTGRVVAPDISDRGDIKRGQRQQPWALDNILDQCPDTHYADEVWVNGLSEFPSGGHIDRLGVNWLAEAKCPRISKFYRIRETGPEDAHVIQVQYYLLLTGVQIAYLSYFHADPWESETFRIKPSPRIHEIMIDRCVAFWSHVENDTPPEMDAVIELPKIGTGVEVATDEQTALLTRWRELDTEIKDREGLLKDIKREVANTWPQDAGKIRGEFGSCSFIGGQRRKSFDQKRFKAEHADLAAEYVKESQAAAHLRPYWKKSK